jgi:hypothetical protein
MQQNAWLKKNKSRLLIKAAFIIFCGPEYGQLGQ